LICFDSTAWIEYFKGGPKKAELAKPMKDIGEILVPTVCLVEVGRFLNRYTDEATASEYLDSMAQGQVVDLDRPIAILASRLGIKHGLPLADSIIYATAKTHHADLWTFDCDFKGLGGVRHFNKK
jgi:predicted nucleic acid-binding protein